MLPFWKYLFLYLFHIILLFRFFLSLHWLIIRIILFYINYFWCTKFILLLFSCLWGYQFKFLFLHLRNIRFLINFQIWTMSSFTNTFMISLGLLCLYFRATLFILNILLCNNIIFFNTNTRFLTTQFIIWTRRWI